MPPLFWTGKLSWPMAVMVNTNNLLAGVIGRARNIVAMKTRMKLGYEGAFSDHVLHYDEVGWELQMRAARAHLEGTDVRGKSVLDVGCGTGVLSIHALEKGAAKTVCGDISPRMLETAGRRAAERGYGPKRMSLQELDAGALPFPDETFDVVLTAMTWGLLPDQPKALSEMVRVCRKGGLVGIGAHGPEHYWEAIDASLRKVTKRYVLGYRLEFWPITEQTLERQMTRAGLNDIRLRHVLWRNDFSEGGKAFEFFASISASWWYSSFPKGQIEPCVARTRRFFVEKPVTRITDDVIFGYGIKK
jgi:ubiquinone/menaquinone biosynthesis C-methylase UbiE